MIDQAVRRAGIGGSEVAAVLGVDEGLGPFDIWLLKSGEYDAPATPRMKLGKIFERAIIDYYSALTGRATDWVDRTYRHETREWMVYTPDALCRDEMRGVDAKLVAWDQRHRWGDTPAEIPTRAQLQAHYYMAALDYPVWDVIALVDMDEPRIYTFDRDAELESAMLEGVEEFYRRYIVGGERPPMGASDACAAWLKQRFPRNKADIRNATEREAELLDLYTQARAEEKAATAERTRLEHEIKEAIAEAEGLSWARGRFTWKCTKDSQLIDWHRLAESLMRGYNAEERAATVAEYSETRPGIRRVHFSSKEAA
jgi:predicted phage-related endonuclease